MAEGDFGGQERTESPTPRRRQLARSEGQVARSPELSAAISLLAGASVLALLSGHLFADYARRTLVACGSALSGDPLSATSGAGLLRSAASGFLASFLPFGLGVAGIVVAVNLIQARGVLSWKPVTPDLGHLDPLKGIRRLFSTEALFQAGKSLAKLAALSLVTYFVIARSWPEMTALVDAGPNEVVAVLKVLLLRLALLTGGAFLILSGADYAFQWFRLERSLRMTRQEVLRDLKDSEGDPHVKARLQSLARAQARRRMLSKVPTADVVVVNPTEIAVALKYDVDLAPAPVVVAMGQRKLAERIKGIALRSNVPVVENRPVARALLATAKVGRPIPPALYTAVAEILAFVYRQRGRIPAAPAATPPRKIV